MYPPQWALVIGEFPDFSEISALRRLPTFRSPAKFPQSFNRPQSSTNHGTYRPVVAGDDDHLYRFRSVLRERIPGERIHNVRQSETRIPRFRRAESETGTFALFCTRLASRQYPIASTMLSLILQVTHFL
ncbi:MAG: hypothetical protein ACI8P0_000705 [Planctomycetaceae bacterium]|jgi:hypothetical protein